MKDELPSCPLNGKESFKSRSAVPAARLNGKRGIKLHVYRCPDCHFFHLTSQS